MENGSRFSRDLYIERSDFMEHPTQEISPSFSGERDPIATRILYYL